MSYSGTSSSPPKIFNIKSTSKIRRFGQATDHGIRFNDAAVDSPSARRQCSHSQQCAGEAKGGHEKLGKSCVQHSREQEQSDQRESAAHLRVPEMAVNATGTKNSVPILPAPRLPTAHLNGHARPIKLLVPDFEIEYTDYMRISLRNNY